MDVLIIEDSLADFKLAALLLKESSVPSFGIRHAVRLEEALKILGTESFDIILLDLDLPDSSGLDGLKKITGRPGSPPVVVLTGLEDEEMGLEALKHQASDFLVKGRLTLNGLIRSLLYALERKRAEEILKRDKEAFERLVEERTRELVKAQMELEKTKRLSDIGVLATTVAHELRNPLAAIGIAVYNIRRIVIHPDIDKPLGHIDKMLVESDQIINNLLSYSRIRPPHYERVNIIDILEESIAFIEDKRIKYISIIKNLDSLKNISIEADPVQIKEILNNILNNACDAAPSKKGKGKDKAKVKVAAENEDEFIKVAIEDSGTGMDQETLEKAFDPFFTTKAKGTGLGLSVCRQIVDFHGGSISIESEAGQGTVVIVRLPKERKRVPKKKNPRR